MAEKPQPVQVLYCGVCGLPAGYCEFGPDFEKCKPWLIQNAPDLYPDFLKETDKVSDKLQSTSISEGIVVVLNEIKVIQLTMDVYITLRFYHGGKLQQKPRIKYDGGRPRKCRRKEQNENKTGKLSKKGVEMTCSLCHSKGHNKRGYHLSDQANTSRGRGKSRGTSSGRSSVGSSVAPNESEPTTKRPRGRPVGSTKQATTSTTVAASATTTDVTGRGRGPGGVVDAASIIGRGRGVIGRGRGPGGVADAAGVIGRGRCVIGRGRGPGGVANVSVVTGRGRGTPPLKRPNMVGMGVLHTQSGFTIHNPGMPMNSSIVTGNLGPHKPRSGVKWKGKSAVTQHGLQEMREHKRMRTMSKAAEMNQLSQSSSTFE